jgi:DNA polymerase
VFGGGRVRGAKSILDFGLDREDVYVTNICKCYPKISKTPNMLDINRCGETFKKEMEVIQPFVILAFGNTCVKFFKNQRSGIMDLSGTAEWSDEYSCWICWCIHPASILYSPENKDYYNRGIKKFGELVSSIGYGL